MQGQTVIESFSHGGASASRLNSEVNLSNAKQALDHSSARSFKAAAAALILLVLGLSGCTTARIKPPATVHVSAPKAEVLGPPEPEKSYGPDLQDRKSVTVILGPGMSGTFAGAGVIRALLDSGVAVDGVAGSELGAFVAAAYASQASVNRMDWMMLQFRSEWVQPGPVLSRLFLGGKTPTAALDSGLRAILRDTSPETLGVPFWLLNVETRKWSTPRPRASIGPVICAEIASAAWFSPCPGNQHGQMEGAIPDRSLPWVWVIPSLPENTPDRTEEERSVALLNLKFQTLVQELKGPRDLVIIPRVRPQSVFDFSGRSEIIFSGKRETREALGAWLKSLGWDQLRKGARQ